MILDLEHNVETQPLFTDICILGGGPAGLTIAKEFLGAGVKAIVVESGGLSDDKRAVALYDGFSVGHPVDLFLGRYRILGGASTRWGGRCAVLDPLDFEYRPWVPNSGWPIAYKDLAPFYERAKSICNFRLPWLSQEAIETALNTTLPPLSSRALSTQVWRYATSALSKSILGKGHNSFRAALNFGSAFRDAFKVDSDITVLLHGNITHFEFSESATKVESVQVSTLDGRKTKIVARHFILCCGGIENPKIILNFPHNVLSRVNRYDNVGRYFHQHPVGTVGVIEADRAATLSLQKTFNMFFRREMSTQYEIGLSLSSSTQQKLGLLNASVALYYGLDHYRVWRSAQRVRGIINGTYDFNPALLVDLIIMIFGAPVIADNIIRRFVLGREVRKRRASIRAVVNLEQQPDRESRVYLSNDVDAMGMKKIVIDWKISKRERETAQFIARALELELQANKLGRLRMEPWLTSDSSLTENDLKSNLHFMGATRMAHTDRTGVVDKDCKLFGLENLFVAGTSVFPTGGHANPMLTIVALAIRLADHLKCKLLVRERDLENQQQHPQCTGSIVR